MDVLNDSNVFGISEYDLSEIHLLNILEIIDINEEEDNANKIIHLPIEDKNGNIILIFDVIVSDESITCTIGNDFAKVLNISKKDNENILLLQDGYLLYAIGDNCSYVQKGQDVSLIDETTINKLSNIPLHVDATSTYSYNLNKINDEFTDLAMVSYKTSQKESSNYPKAVTGSKNLSNYPIVGQYIDGDDEQKGLCWAATTASIARYTRPSTYSNLSGKEVADYMNIGYDDGATNNEVKKALEHYLGSSYPITIKNSVLSTSNIKSIIDSNNPAYMQSVRSNGLLKYKYHATALVGYSFSSSTTSVRIMDPAYETFKNCKYSDGAWTFAFGKYYYTWISTITIK